MVQSLSIVLPVRNAQDRLAAQIHQLLDVVPDLTHQFEILIVDDGSTDGTEELAHELARQFPQLQIVHRDRAEGKQQAIKSGLERCRGDVIFVKDDPAPLRVSDIRQLWAMRKDPELVMARSEPQDPRPLDPLLINRLVSWGAALEQNASPEGGGLQMIRRQAVEQLREDEPTFSPAPIRRPVLATVAADGLPSAEMTAEMTTEQSLGHEEPSLIGAGAAVMASETSGPSMPSAPAVDPMLAPPVSRSEQISRRMPPRPLRRPGSVPPPPAG